MGYQWILKISIALAGENDEVLLDVYHLSVRHFTPRYSLAHPTALKVTHS